MATTYKDAGVDVERGYEAVRRIKAHVQRTLGENALGGLGGFGGCWALGEDAKDEPVLVAGTDGVGTKLKIAFALDKHDTVGIDLVAMCVNDVLCQGARPLFFLDYIASSRIDTQRVESIVAGIAEGCVQVGAALLGGETAEMPGMYAQGEYDLAGFAVGVVPRAKVITPDRIQAGDVLLGLASSGVHSNGFSLVRKLLGEDAQQLNQYDERLGTTIGEALLVPTRIYVKPVLDAIARFDVHGVSHITGGGFIENIPRMLPDGLCAAVRQGSYPIPPIFQLLQEKSGMSDEQMHNTFNMGIGMVLAVPAEQAQAVQEHLLAEYGERAYVIGSIQAGEGIRFYG